MSKTKKIVVANWKMNPPTAEEAKAAVSALRRFEKQIRNTRIVVCPPILYLESLCRATRHSRRISFGVQDVSGHSAGSHTGEIGPEMVYNAGGRFAIIGHSERRSLGETDEIISKKILLALKAGLSVILCVGETERDSHGSYLGFLRDTVRASLAGVSKKFLAGLLVAYEPVFAVGKTEAEALQAEEIEAMAIYIRKVLSDIYGQEETAEIPVLYGGSVGPHNAAEIILRGGVQGLLVGHQSLLPDHFKNILTETDRV